MPTLNELLSASCKPSITLKMLQDLDRYVATYEVRDDNPLAFNTPMLGVHKAYFYPKDSDTIFSIFNIDKNELNRCIKQCPGIDKSFNVVSNDFNILVIWLVHNLRKVTTISKPAVINACMNLFKLLHYKFFTSKVSQQFQYGAKEGVMQYTIDNLTAKSDIKNAETDTWKKIIYKHCDACMGHETIYTVALNNFTPDSAITKCISDIHTRLCRKIVLISEAYYENNKKGNTYTTSSIMMDDDETGMKVLGDLKGTLDLSTNRICTAALNTTEFIDMGLVQLAAKLTSSIRPDAVKDMLVLFSSMATVQVKDKDTAKVIIDKNRQPIYVGYVTLIEEMVQKTYRRAALMGVDINSNVAVLNAAKNSYTASRITDKDIAIIKNSVDYFMANTKYTRQGTLVSLRLALVLYIMLLSFKYR